MPTLTPAAKKSWPTWPAAAQPGDILLVLGARDPTLTDFAKKLLSAVRHEQQSKSSCQECMLGNCCMAYKK